MFFFGGGGGWIVEWASYFLILHGFMVTRRRYELYRLPTRQKMLHQRATTAKHTRDHTGVGEIWAPPVPISLMK